MTRQQEIQREAAAEGRDPATRHIILALAVVAVMAFVSTAVAVYLGWQAAREGAEAGRDLAAQVAAACHDSIPDTQQVKDLCEKAEAVQEQIPGPAGEKGEKGDQGDSGPPPSDAAVARAVRLYCAETDGCKGRNATQSQVVSAVATYCNDRGQCRGKPGRDGTDGQDGTDGTPGPGPTAEQIASAVTDYCSNHDGCKGPPGVVNAQDACEFAAGQFVQNVGITYADQIITLTCDTGEPPALVVTCSYVSFWAYPEDPSLPGAPVAAQQYTVATDCT